jgi:hypothetical protein
MTHARLPLEHTVTEPRVLVIDYMVRQEIRAVIRPGHASVGRALRELGDVIHSQPNIDPRTIRYRIEDPNHG